MTIEAQSPPAHVQVLVADSQTVLTVRQMQQEDNGACAGNLARLFCSEQDGELHILVNGRLDLRLFCNKVMPGEVLGNCADMMNDGGRFVGESWVIERPKNVFPLDGEGNVVIHMLNGTILEIPEKQFVKNYFGALEMREPVSQALTSQVETKRVSNSKASLALICGAAVAASGAILLGMRTVIEKIKEKDKWTDY
jgi:hypothetical protein